MENYIDRVPPSLDHCHVIRISDQVTLVALGPLTNVALSFLLDNTLSSQLFELYFMGGNIEGMGNHTVASEFNFGLDPEAAFAVLDRVQCPTYVTALEPCYRQINISQVSKAGTIGRGERRHNLNKL